jgi:membrane-associated progesterone receptor component
VLVAAKGRVFDMTRGRDFYGKGGPYNCFAGADVSRALAKVSPIM